MHLCCAVCVLLSHATKGMKPEAHKHDVHHACRLFWLVRFTLIYLYCYSDPRPLNCAEDSCREAINWFAIVPSQMETQNRPTGCSHDAFTRTEGPRCIWRQVKALVSQCYLLSFVFIGAVLSLPSHESICCVTVWIFSFAWMCVFPVHTLCVGPCCGWSFKPDLTCSLRGHCFLYKIKCVLLSLW